MFRPSLTLSAITASVVLSFMSAPVLATDDAPLSAPPGAPYAAVSDLVPLPDFIPGLGQLFVDPATLPAGPFLGYDHEGVLVSTTYMVPLSLITDEFNLDGLKAPAGKVDHVDMMYNAGHPGVEEPHIHVVLWNISPDQKSRVAK